MREVYPNSSMDHPHAGPTCTSHDARSHILTLQVPFAHTVSFYNSFCRQATQIWNELPFEVLSSPSTASFERACYNYVSINYPSPHYVFVYILFLLTN